MKKFILDDCNTFLQKYFNKINDNGRFNVLEAGGGSFSHFFIPNNANIICIDISFGQLIRNETLQSRIQGDLQSLPINKNKFDMINCFNVIEHLEDPSLALEQLYSVLKDNGLLVVGCPNRSSLKSIITRMTPVSIHRLYYRFIVGKKDRGEGHCDAFPTPFKSIVSERRLQSWIHNKRMKIQFFKSYDGVAAYKLISATWKSRLFYLPYYGLALVLRLLSLNIWQPTNSDILFIAQKKSIINNEPMVKI